MFDTRTPEMDHLNWFALFVRTKHELSVQRNLHDKGYDTYVPCRPQQRRWADRVKVTEQPLFPNYVFCRFPVNNPYPVVTTPEVYSVVSTGRTPTPIPLVEIEQIRLVVQFGTEVHATETCVVPGEHVRVIAGALRDLEGVVVRVKSGWRLVVGLTLLNRGVATEIDRDCVQVLASGSHGAMSHISASSRKPDGLLLD
jgi:transcription termination/antitermination protein NusG